MRREVQDRIDVLRLKRDAIYEVQRDMLILFCQLDKEADRLEREETLNAESVALLRQARKWLGRDVREVA